MENSLFFLLENYLKKEQIFINKDELKLQLQSHPSYPSMHSITGVLDHFGIDNMALEVPSNREIVGQLPVNFIAHVEKDNTKEFVLVDQSDDYVKLIYANKKKGKIEINEFLKIWNGIILVVENENIESDNQKTKFRKRPQLIYVLTALLIVSIFFSASSSSFKILHFIFSLIGVTISVLIVTHELGYNSKTIEKFCSNTKNTTSCNAVLNSKGALVFGLFKLSDISFIYFAGLVVAWLISTNVVSISTPIIILTIVSLPVTLYSIYYQYKVVKKWCPLCLGIVGVLWLQGLSLLLTNSSLTKINQEFKSSLIIVMSFLILMSLWMFIKPFLNKSQELQQLKIKHYKFKRDFNLFNALYSSNQILNIALPTEGEIILGNKNASLQLLLVTNPACFYCKTAHTDVEQILSKNLNSVSLTIRFNVSTDKDSMPYKIALRLLEIYNTESEEQCLKAISEAYKENVDFSDWLATWGEPVKDDFDVLLKESKQWCMANNINFTPAFFVNGKEYPKEFERMDLLLFIDELTEQAVMPLAAVKLKQEVIN